MQGLMQNWPLTVDRILDHAKAWHGDRHIEAWYAIMGMGAVCHTLNPRLFAEQLCYIINHAEDRIIFTDLTFVPILAENRAKMPSVKQFVVMTDRDGMK